MNEIEVTDLVCKSRREELSESEERRLEHLMQTSVEVRLMGRMLPELEHESLVRAGDEALLARITAKAISQTQRTGGRRRPAMLSWLLAAAVLLVGSAAAAWMTYSETVWHRAGVVAPPLRTPDGTGRRTAAPRGGALTATPPAPSAAPSRDSAPIDDSDPPKNEKQQARRAGETDAARLFARANLLRREGRGGEALELYRTIVQRYPKSREASPARLVVAKQLMASDPAEALSHYRVLAGRGGALRAEALWGVAESASSLGRTADEQRALSELIREFPNSAYAEAARGRLQHDPP